jgi:hypothetical protein
MGGMGPLMGAMPPILPLGAGMLPGGIVPLGPGMDFGAGAGGGGGGGGRGAGMGMPRGGGGGRGGGPGRGGGGRGGPRGTYYDLDAPSNNRDVLDYSDLL